MYSNYRKSDARAIRAVVALAWAASALIGVLSALEPGPVLASALTPLLLDVGGYVVAAAALIGVYSSARDHWRCEWLVSLLAGAGLVPFLTAGWWVSGAGIPYMIRALMATLMMLFFVSRVLTCWGRSNRLRDEKAQLEALERALEERED